MQRKSCELHSNAVSKTSDLCEYFEKLKVITNDMCSGYNECKAMHSIQSNSAINVIIYIILFGSDKKCFKFMPPTLKVDCVCCVLVTFYYLDGHFV